MEGGEVVNKWERGGGESDPSANYDLHRYSSIFLEYFMELSISKSCIQTNQASDKCSLQKDN